ncbi:NAD(P)-dependent oxidoreductase [Amycolatopsis regifaucium]|uniref:3-hydroxyisobutyrate dehydrogenase n=1 Tax=Amycolatopsis regifaucium TaxID=546365 RepID=A0A154MY95_9PSEU|nr:NAD(P)-dependent oxidoreductase [Amycolatopsis regifaucium]KZB88439.1 3-hydroxyisobutyrate dehydrogenase [Amycolatopsis regifaucium]OKA11521.1 3-hydroxyisobutyrate dehydrogenase [Amycolatopsis regifaucium]SFH41995.1 3-hydroxyisobutyrate dehydrogenase [Amycolatopsis regifaucium]
MTARVAAIGLGEMGSGMVRALLAARYEVVVFNRTTARAEALRAAGAQVAATAAEAVEDASLVLVSLADEDAVTQVLLGDLAGMLTDRHTVLDTSTVSPRFSIQATAKLAETGVRRIESCVMGNPEMAREGRLRVFAAGEEPPGEDVSAVFDALGQQVTWLGETGRASTLKLAFNLLLGVQTAGLAEALDFAESAGIDRTLMLDVFSASGWYSPILGFRARFMRERAYKPAAFRSVLMHKDLRLGCEDAAGRGVPMPVTVAAADRYARVVDAGFGDDDAAVIAEGFHSDTPSSR